MKRSELKFKVVVIAMSLNYNKIANSGDLVSESQMQSTPEQLLEAGFIEHTDESAAYFKEQEEAAAEASAADTDGDPASKEDVVAEIEEMLKDELIAWTEAQIELNDLFDHIDLDANKADILAAVLEVVNSEEFVA